MTFKRILLVPLLWVLTGCVTELTSEARLVREIDKTTKNQCRFIATEQFLSATKVGGTRNYMEVQNQMRIKTAELGGNAFVIADLSGGGGKYGAIFEVYFCKDFEQTVIPPVPETAIRRKAI
jgi:hypothetical protein